MLSTLAPSSTLRRSRRQYRLRSCCVVIDPAPSSTLRRPRRRHRLRNARSFLPTKRCASLASHKELGPALEQPMATEIWNDIWNGRGGGRTPTSPKKRRPLPVLHDALSPRPRLSTVSGLFAPTQLVRPVSRLPPLALPLTKFQAVLLQELVLQVHMATLNVSHRVVQGPKRRNRRKRRTRPHPQRNRRNQGLSRFQLA